MNHGVHHGRIQNRLAQISRNKRKSDDLEGIPKPKKKKKTNKENVEPVAANHKEIINYLNSNELRLKEIVPLASNEAFLTRQYVASLTGNLKQFLDASDLLIHFPALLDFNARIVSINQNLTLHLSSHQLFDCIFNSIIQFFF